MPSEYSTSLKIQLMATGENNSTWGTITNTNLATAIEEAIVGSTDVVFANSNVTLTLSDTNGTQPARNLRLNLTGSTGGSSRNLVVPDVEKPYIVYNGCGDNVVVKTAAGVGVTVPPGKTMWVYNNGTNVVDVVTHLSSVTLNTPLSAAYGGLGNSNSDGSALINLNASNITSGTVALARGGTGANDAANARVNLLPSYAGNGGKILALNAGATDVTWVSAGGVGTVTSVNASTSLSGLTFSGGPITAAGTLSLSGTLGITSGGTGASTFSTGALLVGNGTSSFSTIAPGASGNILTSNGSAWVSSAAPATGVSSFNTRTGAITLTGLDVTTALGYTPASTTAVVSSFNSRTGSVTLQSTDVTSALGYTPLSTAVTSFNSRTGGVTLTSSDVTSALGFTPASSSAVVTSLTAGTGITLSAATGAITISATGTVSGVSSFNTRTGAVTLSSTDVTTALTYTPASSNGSNATGTWGINISGNAATATSATSATNATNVTGTVGTANGGTGQTTYSNGQLLIGNGSGLSKATLTAGSGITITNGAGTITIAASGGSGVSSITGTTNQVIASASTGAVTLSLPQSINTTAGVQFGSFGVGTAASGTTGEIRATNNVTAYYSSDARLKENVKPIESALDKVSAIGGKTFDWTDKYIEEHGGADGYFVRKSDFGVIAQDVEAVFPLAVRTREDGTLAVDYEKMCALAFQAIAELRAEVEALKRDA